MHTLTWFNKNRPPCGAPAVMSDKIITYLESKKDKSERDKIVLKELKKTEKEYGESVWVEDSLIEPYYESEEEFNYHDYEWVT